MKLTNGLLALGLAALPASALARDDSNPTGPGVLRDDASDLVKKLGDKDYKVRRDAFKKLETMGDDARAALETAAKGDDAEIRWNASRLLDRLDDNAPTQQKRRDAPPARRAEGLKVRTGASDDNDDGDDATAARPRTRVRVFGQGDFEQQMRELESRMHDFEKQFDEGGGTSRAGPFGFRMFDNPFGGLGGGTLQLGPGSSFQRSVTNDGKSESLSIQVDANGHVTAEQTADGKTTKFEADSLEALQKEHPGLLHAGPAVIAIHPGRLGRQAATAAPDTTDATPDPTNVKPRRKVKSPLETPSKELRARDADDTDDAKDAANAGHKPVLGIELAPVPPAVAEYLELEGGALQIMRVVDDMPAAKRGLKARDILLEVDGKKVHEFDDVVRALEGADPSKVPLVVLRHGEKKKL